MSNFGNSVTEMSTTQEDYKTGSHLCTLLSNPYIFRDDDPRYDDGLNGDSLANKATYTLHIRVVSTNANATGKKDDTSEYIKECKNVFLKCKIFIYN